MQGTDGHSHTQGKGFPSCSQLGSHSAPGPQILVPLGPDSLMGKDPRTLWSWTASSSLTCDAAWSSDAVFPLRNHSSQVLRTMRTAELSRDFDFDFVCFWFWIHMSVPYMHIWVCVLMSVGTCVYKGACFHRCLCTHVKAWGCHQVLSSVSPPPPPFNTEAGSLTEPKAHRGGCLTSQLLCPPHPWVTGGCHAHLAFMWFWGSELRSWCALAKPFPQALEASCIKTQFKLEKTITFTQTVLWSSFLSDTAEPPVILEHVYYSKKKPCPYKQNGPAPHSPGPLDTAGHSLGIYMPVSRVFIGIESVNDF